MLKIFPKKFPITVFPGKKPCQEKVNKTNSTLFKRCYLLIFCERQILTKENKNSQITMTQITDLPDLCVRYILAYLPWIDIVRIDRALPEWTLTQRHFLKKRSRLRLLLGDKDPMQLFRENSLNIPLEEELASVIGKSESSQSYIVIELGGDQIADRQLELLNLPQLLQSVECLEVAVSDLNESSLDRTIVPLIGSFADRLITFKFRCFLLNEDDDHHRSVEHGDQHAGANCPAIQFHSLLECINTRMVKLECLHLDIRDPICLTQFSGNELRLPILRQLKEFRFFSYDTASILYGSLHRYATDRLRTIAISNMDDGENLLTQFGAKPLAKCFEILPNITIGNDFASRQRYFTAFDSLRSVWLSLADHTLSQLTRYLLPLRHLTHLNLSIDYVRMSKFDSIADEQIQPLPVRALTLMISTKSHRDLRSRHWRRMFAACHILDIHHFGVPCADCDYTPHNYAIISESETANRINACRKSLLAPFKALPSLRKIYFKDYFISKSVDSLELSPDQL